MRRRCWTLWMIIMTSLLFWPNLAYTAPLPGGSTSLAAAIQTQQDVYHLVAAGETLFSIARRYRTTVSELARLNNITNTNLIYVGQRLLVQPGGGTTPPVGSPPPATPPGTARVHVVQRGETIYGIARLYGVTPQAITQANGLANPSLIYVGQRLTIPGGGTTTPPPPSGGTPSSSGMRWGIQAHMLNEEMSRIVSAASEMRLDWLKQQIRWADFEKTPGNIQWGPIDTLVANAGGKQLLFSVVAAPDWARTAGTDTRVPGPPQDPATLAAFLEAMASRYCGKVQAIEVWNEQNLAREWGNETLSAARYMQLLKAAYPAIKRGCASMMVVSGALTPTGAPPPAAIDDFTYLTQMYQNGLRQLSDAVGVHPSGFNVPPNLYFTQACAFIQQSRASFRGPCDTPHHSWAFRSTLEGTRNIMVQAGDGGKMLWVTEFGWAVGDRRIEGYEFAADNTREEQAAWTAQAFAIARTSGYVGAMFLWNMNFAVVQPGSEQALWSVYGTDYAPTITVPAVRDTAH
ncbi:MAG: LysM peptidoglycan-binding domain-containing protein [Ardenticatenales bacterium]|nr:LysM peptidoglycan-binding domain-containing protein [Ardenticatenales bacterium]